MRKNKLLLPMLLLTALIINGCASIGSSNPQAQTAKTLLSARQATIAAAGTIDALCSQGVLKQADCDTAAGMYADAQAAYVSAANAFLLALNLGDQKSWSEYRTREQTYLYLSNTLYALSQNYQGGK